MKEQVKDGTCRRCPAAHRGKTKGVFCFFKKKVLFFFTIFSRMRSEGSRFTWGSGGESVSTTVRNRSQPFATVRNRRQVFATACVSTVRLSTVASASGVVPKACQVE